MISVSVNGEAKQVEEGCTVSSLMDGLGFDKTKVAVEIDGRICPKRAFSQTALVDGNRLEVVSFVGGG